MLYFDASLNTFLIWAVVVIIALCGLGLVAVFGGAK